MSALCAATGSSYVLGGGCFWPKVALCRGEILPSAAAPRVLAADTAAYRQIAHQLEHIEEERRDIFTKAKSCGMELATLGGRIQSHRAEVAMTVQEA